MAEILIIFPFALLVFLIALLLRIDLTTIDLIHQSNMRCLESRKGKEWSAEDEQHFDLLLGRYRKITASDWTTVFDMTRWTIKQCYPWLMDK